jgi:hypothetical protein
MLSLPPNLLGLCRWRIRAKFFLVPAPAKSSLGFHFILLPAPHFMIKVLELLLKLYLGLSSPLHPLQTVARLGLRWLALFLPAF